MATNPIRAWTHSDTGAVCWASAGLTRPKIRKLERLGPWKLESLKIFDPNGLKTRKIERRKTKKLLSRKTRKLKSLKTRSIERRKTKKLVSRKTQKLKNLKT